MYVLSFTTETSLANCTDNIEVITVCLKLRTAWVLNGNVPSIDVTNWKWPQKYTEKQSFPGLRNLQWLQSHWNTKCERLTVYMRSVSSENSLSEIND